MSESAPNSINPYYLDVQYRNPLQAKVIERMLGEEKDNRYAQLRWVREHGARVSTIVDAPEHEALRVLAREGRYDEAADQVIALLTNSH